MVLKIDLGCGPSKKPEFSGCDRIAFPGVDYVFDLGAERWPFEDSSVDEAHSSHTIEHLDRVERVFFFNELWRVLKPEAKALIIAPHWSSGRAYGDPTHQWGPISDFMFYYLKREWRLTQAPHTDIAHWPQGYLCDFEATWGYSFRNDAEFMARNDHYKQYAMANYRDVIMDIVATLVAKKPSPAAEPAPPPPA